VRSCQGGQQKIDTRFQGLPFASFSETNFCSRKFTRKVHIDGDMNFLRSLQI
jgi:hypothetical protein